MSDTLPKIVSRLPATLTYRILNGPSNGDMVNEPQSVQAAIDEALKIWADVSEFSFVLTAATDASANLTFSFGDPGMRQGEGKRTLASATLVDNRPAIVFLDEIRWTTPEQYPQWKSWLHPLDKLDANLWDLPTVAAHEIGHALGLDHNTTDKLSVMQPYSDLFASTLVYGIRDRRLPDCDAVSLADLYGTGLKPFLPLAADQAPWIVVGGRFLISNQTSHAPGQEVANCSWGDPGFDQQVVATGYCWNEFTNTDNGYGYLILHLAKSFLRDSYGDQPALVGGYISYYNQTSSNQPSTAMRWGSQEGTAQMLGKFYAWNPYLNPAARGYVYVFGVLGTGQSAITIHGGRSEVGASYRASDPKITNGWGDLSKGSHSTVAETITYDQQISPAYLGSALYVTPPTPAE